MVAKIDLEQKQKLNLQIVVKIKNKLELRTLNCAVDFLEIFLDRVWTRVKGLILGLLLLFSVIPLLSDNSEPIKIIQTKLN